MKKILFFIGSLFAFGGVTHRINILFQAVKIRLYSGYYSPLFKHMGRNSVIKPSVQMTRGLKYISLGDNCYLGQKIQLTAWVVKGMPLPKITMGNYVSIGDNSHVTAINEIRIGNNVLTGKRVLITDNAHGASDLSLMDMNPSIRPLYSKGPVVIEDNVWIGEKATILPNVTIGHGAIIAANSVVTKNVPAYTIVAGNPAVVVKTLRKD